MYKVTKQMRTETAHRLDGHPGRCKNIHGHSYLWEVSLETPQLSLSGMVEDFSDLKRHMNDIIDPFDHCLVLEESVEAEAIMDCLAGSRMMTMECPPTAENMAGYVQSLLAKRYPACNVSVKLWETSSSYAEVK